MNDTEKIMLHIDNLPEGEEISDACARVIASQYHGGQSTEAYSFVSTGNIASDTLWREMFLDIYNTSTSGERLMMDYMGTYLLNRADKGTVRGWHMLWL